MRYGDRWETVGKPIGAGGQGQVYRVVDSKVVTLVAGDLAGDVRAAVSGLGHIGTKEQHADHVARLLNAVAKHVALNDPKNHRALKVLRKGVRDEDKARARLEREVNILRGRDHPHLVTVLDADVAEGWFVMPFYAAGTLEDHLKRRRAPFRGRPLEVLQAVRPLIDAVAELHVERVVHRDIKPKNIFVAEHGGWVLGDFGLVFDPEAEGERPTSTFENVGTRPWQAVWTFGRRQAEPSPSEDVVALGKLIWLLVSGQQTPPPVMDAEHALGRRFPDDARTAALDLLLARCIVAEEAACLRSAVEVLGEVDALIGIFRRGGPWPVSAPRRRPLEQEPGVELVKALKESESIPEPTVRTLEALKDLANMAPWTALEGARLVMRSVAHYAARDRGEAGRTALETINAILDANPQAVSEPWAEAVRSELLTWCLEPRPSGVIASQVMRLLPRAARAEDVNVLGRIIDKWTDGDLYNVAPPHEWIKRVYGIAPADLRATLDALLEPTVSDRTRQRVLSIREVLRAMDRERAQREIEPDACSR